MLAMRPELAKIAVLLTASLLASDSEQQAVSNSLPETKSNSSCPSSNAHNQRTPGPEISIAGMSFSGALQMAVVDQDQIADSVRRETHGTSVDGITGEALERVRAGWQNRGYFKVQVTGEARTISSQHIALFVHVDEGAQYKLSGITFKNNKAIRDVVALRRHFPIKDGDIFSRERIAKGLDNLREAYRELGYINFTYVPDTKFDDEDGLIFPQHRRGRGQAILCQQCRRSRFERTRSTGDIEGLSSRSNLQRQNLRAVSGKTLLPAPVLLT
jgi:outer membrane protein assembly factor BamA